MDQGETIDRQDGKKRGTFLSVCWSESFLFSPDTTLVLFASFVSSFKGGTETLNFGLSSNFSEASEIGIVGKTSSSSKKVISWTP